MMKWTPTIDLINVVGTIKQTSEVLQTEGGAEDKGVEEPLVLKINEEERTLHTTGIGFTHTTTTHKMSAIT